MFTVQMSTTKVGFMDVKEINGDVSPELYADMLAGDRSILRKVFGTPLLSYFITTVLPNNP